MSDYLTDDVKINILSRLSMKALLCCRSVCKSWKALIASPYLIKAHLHFIKDNPPQILISSCKKISIPKWLLQNPDSEENDREKDRFKETYLCYGNTETFDLHNKFDLPFVGDSGPFGIAGSCNGLICLHNGNVPVLIWNPFINKAIILPDPIFLDNDKASSCFGFDIARNDYKIVRITHKQNIELYRLSTRIWEDITHLATIYYPFGDPVYVHGVAHWITVKEVSSKILLFDMHSEVFQVMEFPSTLEISDSDPQSTLLAGHEGSLYLVQGLTNGTFRRYYIWLMKEYGVIESWIKQFSMDAYSLLIPRFFLNNGELVWECPWILGTGEKGNTLILYDFQNEEFSPIIKERSTSKEIYQFYAGSYVPSLVLHDLKVDWDRTLKSETKLGRDVIHHYLGAGETLGYSLRLSKCLLVL